MINKRIRRIKRQLRAIFPTKRKVGFIICGTQKGGTTALDEYLREHPEVCMAEKKEVHFFNEDKNFAGDESNYKKYQSHFSPNKTHKLLGEASPVYMYWESVPKRIFDYNPNTKLIILLRNPIERAHSHWNMMRLNGNENLPFIDALAHEKVRCNDRWSLQHRLHSYIDRGFYLKQLKRIWTHFPREQVLVIQSEMLRHKPDETLTLVSDFLQIKTFEKVAFKDVHSLPYIESMSKKERCMLKSIFQSEIQDLEQELEWDCSKWLD